MDRAEKYLRALNSKSTREKILLVTSLVLRERVNKGGALLLNFSSIMEELQYVFPDRWDIQFERDWKELSKIVLKVNFVIHFPVIKITNSEEMTHTMYDLYVKLESYDPYSSSTDYTFVDFTGKRMTATDEEILSSYQHSHLPGYNYGDMTSFLLNKKEASYGQSAKTSAFVFAYRRFCKGSSEINQILAMLGAKYDKNVFKMFLLQLDLYVRWESIEGRPHIYMKHVSSRAEASNPSVSTLREFYSHLSFTDVNLDFKIEKGKVKVIDNDNFENFLKFRGSVAHNYPSTVRSFLCTKDEKGNYYNIRNIPQSFPKNLLAPAEDLAKISWYFRGELIEFKVIYQTEEQRALNATKPFFIHKKLKEYAKARIESKIEAQRFRSYLTEQLSKIDNNTRSIQ